MITAASSSAAPQREDALEFFARLGPFWTFGILANVVLTALAIAWVVRSMRSRNTGQDTRRAATEDREQGE